MGTAETTPSSRVCPQCDEPRSGDFCGACGSQTVETAARRCAICGTETSASARFCGSCGGALSARDQFELEASEAALLGGAFAAVAVGVVLTHLFVLRSSSMSGASSLFETHPEPLSVTGLPSGYQSLFGLVLQLAILLPASWALLRQKTVTPWAFAAVPIALPSLYDFISALPNLGDVREFRLGFWGIQLAGIGALTVLLGLIRVRERVWQRSSGTPLIYAVGAIATAAAGVSYFISPWTILRTNSELGEFSRGVRWDPYDPWWIAASLVLLIFTVGYPITASLLANREIGAPLALGAACALVLYYGNQFYAVITFNESTEYRTSISLLIPLVAILTSGALAAAIWWKPGAPDEAQRDLEESTPNG